jgi:hypothetical protein
LVAADRAGLGPKATAPAEIVPARINDSQRQAI